MRACVRECVSETERERVCVYVCEREVKNVITKSKTQANLEQCPNYFVSVQRQTWCRQQGSTRSQNDARRPGHL